MASSDPAAASWTKTSVSLVSCVLAAAWAPTLTWAAAAREAAASEADYFEAEGAYRIRPWKRERVSEVRVEAAGLGEKDRTSAGEPEPCATFQPSAAQIHRFFNRARRVSWRGFLHETNWSACHATGTLRLESGTRAEWMVQRLGAGSMTIAGRGYYFDCPGCRLEPPAPADRRASGHRP